MVIINCTSVRLFEQIDSRLFLLFAFCQISCLHLTIFTLRVSALAGLIRRCSIFSTRRELSRYNVAEADRVVFDDCLSDLRTRCAPVDATANPTAVDSQQHLDLNQLPAFEPAGPRKKSSSTPPKHAPASSPAAACAQG